MGHLNSFLARGGGNLNKNQFSKNSNARGVARGGVGGMLKLRFDCYTKQSPIIDGNSV